MSHKIRRGYARRSFDPRGALLKCRFTGKVVHVLGKKDGDQNRSIEE
jgi:hypothetical protein